MDIKEFQAGREEQRYEYRSFLPNPINREWTLSDPKTLTLLEEANRLLGELNAFSQLIPDVDFFIRMHVTKEATTSSRIEGARGGVEDHGHDRRLDTQERPSHPHDIAERDVDIGQDDEDSEGRTNRPRHDAAPGPM
jgi:hypothetical protein